MAKKELYATKALANARRKRGLTQIEMADVLSLKLGRNISHQLYTRWEQKKRPISTDDAIEISRELGQSIKDLFEKGKGSLTR